jgi:hypothetical protein
MYEESFIVKFEKKLIWEYKHPISFVEALSASLSSSQELICKWRGFKSELKKDESTRHLLLQPHWDVLSGPGKFEKAHERSVLHLRAF